MATKRLLSPSFFKSASIGRLSRDARQALIACYCEADDQGVLECKPDELKSMAFPYDRDIGFEECEAFAADLEARKKLVRFEAGGKAYWWIPRLILEQHLDELTIRHPAPPEALVSEHLSSDEAVEYRKRLREAPRKGARMAEWRQKKRDARTTHHQLPQAPGVTPSPFPRDIPVTPSQGPCDSVVTPSQGPCDGPDTPHGKRNTEYGKHVCDHADPPIGSESVAVSEDHTHTHSSPAAEKTNGTKETEPPPPSSPSIPHWLVKLSEDFRGDVLDDLAQRICRQMTGYPKDEIEDAFRVSSRSSTRIRDLRYVLKVLENNHAKKLATHPPPSEKPPAEPRKSDAEALAERDSQKTRTLEEASAKVDAWIKRLSAADMKLLEKEAIVMVPEVCRGIPGTVLSAKREVARKWMRDGGCPTLSQA